MIPRQAKLLRLLAATLAIFGSVVAGGGFPGGRVVGADALRCENVRQRPIYRWDLSGSKYKLLGIDPAGELSHPYDCVAYLTLLAVADVSSGGLPTE